jgi:hypothetical protein
VDYRILLLAMAAVIGISAAYLASRGRRDAPAGVAAQPGPPGQPVQERQADSMPRESAGRL